MISAGKKPSTNPYLDYLMERFPNYQDFTAQDFSKLPAGDLATVLGAFALREHFATDFIPLSFTARYGDRAAAETVLAVERAAAEKGITEGYAQYMLEAGFDQLAQLGAQSGYVKVDVPVTTTIRGSNGKSQKVTATAPELLNYEIASRMLGTIAAKNPAPTLDPAKQVAGLPVPPYITKAIVEDSQQFNRNKDPLRNALPPGIARLPNLTFTLGDEAAFMAGYAASSEGKKINPTLQMDYNAGSNGEDLRHNVFCPIPEKVQKIFSPSGAQQDPVAAWSYGYIQADMDRLPKLELETVMGKCAATRAPARGR